MSPLPASRLLLLLPRSPSCLPLPLLTSLPPSRSCPCYPFSRAHCSVHSTDSTLALLLCLLLPLLLLLLLLLSQLLLLLLPLLPPLLP